MDHDTIFRASMAVMRVCHAISPKEDVINPVTAVESNKLARGRQSLADLAALFGQPSATATPKGTGEYGWYWAAGNSVHNLNGAYMSGDDAQTYARGKNPDGDYTVLCAERHAIDTNVFNGQDVLTALETRNPNCWPAGIPPAATRELEDLAAKLSDCLDRWVRKNGYDTTTALHTISAQDYFPSKK